MCRPSCCKPRSQAPGVAAIALIIGAGIVAGKIGPHVARIVHVAAEVLRSDLDLTDRIIQIYNGGGGGTAPAPSGAPAAPPAAKAPPAKPKPKG